MNTSDCNYKTDKNLLLYFFKGLACIGVICVHYPFPDTFGVYLSKVCEFVVPFFYLGTGYYAYGKDSDTIKRRLIKIAKILFYSLILYTLFWMGFHYCFHDLTEWINSELKIQTLVNFTVFCTIDYILPYWYLMALLQTYIFWYYFVREKKESLLLYTIPILFIGQFYSVTYVETYDIPWCIKVNFITRALSWFLLGYYIHLKKEYVLRINNAVILLSGLAGLGLGFSYLIFKTPADISYIGVCIIATVFFVTGLKYPDVKISNIIEYIGEKLSLNVYVLHVFICEIVLLIWQQQTVYRTFIEIFLTIFAAYIMYKISEINRCGKSKKSRELS